MGSSMSRFLALTERAFQLYGSLTMIRVSSQEGSDRLGGSTLLACLLKWADVQPDSPCVRVSGTGVELSYQQVVSLVGQYSGTLSRHAVKPGDRVYLALENDWTWVVAMLACEAIGAIAVAGNTRLSEHETERMLRHCDPTVILADERQVSKIPPSMTPRVVDVHSAHEGVSLDVTGQNPDSPSLLAYSSGTTGEPKAVLLTARSVARSSATYAELFESGTETTIPVAVPLFHNTGFVDCFGHALTSGGSVDIMRRFDGRAIAQGLATGAYTFFIGVPTMLHRIADTLGSDYVSQRTPWLAYGGAVMTVPVAHQFLSNFPNAKMVNCYGLSEATSITHYLPHDRSEGCWDSIGIPIPGTRDLIINSELYVDSPTLMLGYWDGEHSVATPPALRDGVWLTTRDLVSRGDDGMLRVVSRIDGLINRGGEKIAPYEVERVLAAFRGVTEAVVVGIPDPDLGSVPVAQVAVSDRATFDERALRTHLASELADYKIPVRIMVVDALPRNASGKVHLADVKRALSDES